MQKIHVIAVVDDNNAIGYKQSADGVHTVHDFDVVLTRTHESAPQMLQRPAYKPWERPYKFHR